MTRVGIVNDDIQQKKTIILHAQVLGSMYIFANYFLVPIRVHTTYFIPNFYPFIANALTCGYI